MPQLWTNWAGDQQCAPERIARPGSESELAAEVSAAAEAGQEVRAVGSGHSFTDTACTDGLMVDLSRMGCVLEADTDSGRVSVQAGIKLHALGAELAARGLALENQGDIDRQALAGATATATHGTGARFANLSAQLVGMRLVTATGEVLDLSADSDPEAFLAARVSVGALGIASVVTLQCVPLFTIHRRDEPGTLDEALDLLDEHVDGNDHYEFYAFPYSKTVMNRFSERCDCEPVPVSERTLFVREALIENRIVDFFGRVGRAVPRAVPTLNRVLGRLVSADERTDHAYKVYASRREVKFTEMEYAIPRQDGREAVRRVMEMIERRRLPVAFPIEVRFAAGDDAFLSTAHGRDTCYIAVHQYRGMPFESYFRGVEEIMSSYGGRPHWGKRHYRAATLLRERYPDWDRFQAVRSRLDPGAAFTNDYVRRTLGPVAAQ